MASYPRLYRVARQDHWLLLPGSACISGLRMVRLEELWFLLPYLVLHRAFRDPRCIHTYTYTLQTATPSG